MILKSTRDSSPLVNFSEAVANGLAPDGGLYVPVEYPKFSLSYWQEFRGKTIKEIAFRFFKEFLSDDFDLSLLRKICDEVFTFEAPVIPLADRAGVMELFHGPTFAFKDFGARFMARILPYCKKSEDGTAITVLTATSGDTGAAVAHGFHGVDGVTAVILYPKDKVSPLQERQFATLGGNVHAIAVDGTFDDCQRMVKEAFADTALRDRMNLTSANSINIARLLPQMVYYIGAWSMIPQAVAGKGLTFVVPSGNFGNLVAGIMVSRMALPGVRFIAATNANDVVPKYLSGADFEPRTSVQTISNAMDVGNPSNFERLRSLFGSDQELREFLTGHAVSDETTRDVIKRVWERHKYIADPHTATGLEVWNNLMSKPEFQGRYGVVLGTAHPAKFREVMDEILPEHIKLPNRLAELQEKELLSVECPADINELRNILESLT